MNACRGEAWLAHVAGNEVSSLLHLDEDEGLVGVGGVIVDMGHHLQQLLTFLELGNLDPNRDFCDLKASSCNYVQPWNMSQCLMSKLIDESKP